MNPSASSSNHGPWFRPSSRLHFQFYEIYRHHFGRESSRYHNRAQTWLQSLREGDDHYICHHCSKSRKFVCDRNALRCGACHAKHLTCPRITYFRQRVIMEDLRLTEEQFLMFERMRAPLKAENSTARASYPESDEEDEPGRPGPSTTVPPPVRPTRTTREKRVNFGVVARPPSTRPANSATRRRNNVPEVVITSVPPSHSSPALSPTLRSTPAGDYNERILEEVVAMRSKLDDIYETLRAFTDARSTVQTPKSESLKPEDSED